MSLAEQILACAQAAGLTISTAESCTGGMVAAALTDPPGASAIFSAGFVTYSNAAKSAVLGVQSATLDAHGAVSEPVVLEMARGAQVRAGAGLAVAISGIAGPGGSDHKPEGRVCFAIATPETAHAQTVEFGALGRSAVRAAARDQALRMVLDALPARP